MQDREFTISERIENVCDFFDIEFKDFDYYKDLFLKFEALDENWKTYVENTKAFADLNGFDCIFEQLAVNLIYRHLQGGIFDGFLKERIAFCMLNVKMIMTVCFYNNMCENSKILNICRMYSSEIEYSDENIKKLLSKVF